MNIFQAMMECKKDIDDLRVSSCEDMNLFYTLEEALNFVRSIALTKDVDVIYRCFHIDRYEVKSIREIHQEQESYKFYFYKR